MTRAREQVTAFAAALLIVAGLFSLFVFAACSALSPNYQAPATQPGQPPAAPVLAPTPTQAGIVNGVQTVADTVGVVPVYGTLAALGLSVIGNILGGIWGVKTNNQNNTLTGIVTDVVNAFHGAAASSPTGNVNTADPVVAATVVPSLAAAAQAINAPDAVHATIANLGPAPVSKTVTTAAGAPGATSTATTTSA